LKHYRGTCCATVDLPNKSGSQNDDIFFQTTFTLTNVAPQSSNFNQRAWNQLECMVRKFMERDIDGQDAWIYTGTHGTKAWMNEDKPDKRDVRIPAAYWKGTGLELET
jgi:DNA/RNA endonuclease G (NUC1)